MRAAALVLAILVAIPALSGCFGGPGAVAPRDYLTAADYAKWVVEVDHATGERPSQALLDFLRGRLAPLVHKDAVEFRIDESLGGNADTAWSPGDLRDYADRHRGVETGGGTVATHLLFLAGHFEGDTEDRKVLGIAFEHDLVVIFGPAVKASCSLPAPLCSTEPFFQAVTLHEFGHLLGLVDNGVPMVRDHEADLCAGQEDSHHSTNQASVMFCQVETSAITLLSRPPTDFDADDRADLKAAGGR